MPRVSYEDAKQLRRHERDEGGGRLVPLRIEFEHEDTGELLLAAGGVWDRRMDDYVGDGDKAVVVRLHEGQRRAVEWFSSWLIAHHDRRGNPPEMTLEEIDRFEIDVDPDHAYSALFAGGRRGGKTWIACAIAVCYALMFPGATIWIVSPNNKKHDEIRRYLHAFIPQECGWLDQQTHWAYDFCNGSEILLKGAYGDGGGLKEGKADLVVLNEGQMMMHRAYVVSRGAVVDSSGLVLVCANPPVEAKDQVWVTDFAAESQAGRRASVYIEFNPLLNPHIDRAALLSMRGELDDRAFKIEVLGMFLGPVDAVAYNWLRLENERPVPHGLMDVTTHLLSRMEEGDGITDVAGVDFQRFPYIGGPIYRFFGDPHPDRVLAWIVDEAVLDGGDEADYCDLLKSKHYDPDGLLIVGDASGRYQTTRRSKFDQPPPVIKGGGSFDIIRTEGYRRIVPPQRHMNANPRIQDRARAFTSMICSGVGINRRLFCDPVRAPRTAAAIRDWRQVNGSPSRTQTVAHLGDGASYPIVRLFPRKLRSDKTGSVDPVISLVDRIVSSGSVPRIMPPLRGPTYSGRGSRTRGM